MELSAKKGVQQLVLALAELGVREVVICPGSRNAPFTLSFHRHPAFNCSSIRDERSAAFYALGKAIETNQPVVIVCTSGSAALNFAPAIAEAYYQRIPLIVITADRTKEWTDQGDGQTINQTNLYQNYIRKSYELKGDATTSEELWNIQRSVSEAWAIATTINKGPVHFNVPLSEPLYETAQISVSPQIFRSQHVSNTLTSADYQALATQWVNSPKIMLLIGQSKKDEELQQVLNQLVTWNNLIVFTESTSNVTHADFIENIDRSITNMEEEEKKEVQPDLLITIGGAIVSKRIKTLLRKYSPKSHWNIDTWDSTMDTYQSLSLAIPTEAAYFFSNLLPYLQPVNSTYKANMRQYHQQYQQRHQQFLPTAAYSDLKVFDAIYSSLPKHYHVHFSNSSPIRYSQLFDNSTIESIWCNRGTSGIDGCTSTAVGNAAAAKEKDFLLITGDVAFMYDINALWNEEKVNNLKIIVINNSGGGIFRIIPGPDKVPELEKYFETTMQQNVEHIAAQYQWDYMKINKEEALLPTLHDFFNSSSRCILEIFTDNQQNSIVLEQYWEFLKHNKS